MTRLLDIDTSRMGEALGREPIAIHHNLADHPLLTVEALARLADSLPADGVEHNLADIPPVVGEDEVQSLDLTPGEIARTIETNGCWMVLKDTQEDPAYGKLLDDCLSEVAELVGDREGGMINRRAFIFLSAPGAVTPTHLDPEHNFLLQIRGTKEMNVGRFADPGTRQRELERYFSGGHRNVSQTPDDNQAFPLAPGDGVYVWPNAPHFVVNGPTHSVSLSITWQTPALMREARVWSANGRLRSLRLSPKPPGEREAVDRVKAGAIGALSQVRQRLAR